MTSEKQPRPRILCLILRHGSVGHAVLDGFGVAEHSFFTSRLDHLPHGRRTAQIVKLLARSCARFHPTRVVFGLPGARRADRVALAERLSQCLRYTHIATSTQRLCDAAGLLVHRVRYRMAKEIVDQLVEHFVPELAAQRPRTNLRAWYWYPAWYATAVALAVLTEHHPLTAAALARPGAFSLPAFREALTKSARRLAPPPV